MNNAELKNSGMLACIQQMAIFLVLSQEDIPLTITEVCQRISFIENPDKVWGHMKYWSENGYIARERKGHSYYCSLTPKGKSYIVTLLKPMQDMWFA